MKKLIPAIFLVCTMLNFTSVHAAENSSISYSSASQKLLQNNWDLKKAKNSEYQAKKQYKDVEKSASEMSIDSIKEFYERFLRKSLDKYQEMQLIKQRDLLPKQMEFNLLQAQNNYEITKRSLASSLRDIYFGVLNSDFSVQINEKRLQLAEKKYKQDKARFELGLISQLDMEQLEYNYLKAQQQLKTLKRNRENSIRRLNQYIGEPIDEIYDRIIMDDGFDYKRLQDIDYYINSALSNRVEIPNIEGQIELKKLEMNIMEENNVHIIYRIARHDYAKLQAEVETLQLKLERVKIDIEKNIKNAYIDTEKDIASIKVLENTIELQHEQLKNLENQFKQGMANKIAVEEMKINIEELKNNLLLAIYNCNTKVQRLENAAGFGPAY